MARFAKRYPDPVRISELAPGVILLGVILLLSLQWGGTRPSGYALCHTGIMAALAVSLFFKPLETSDFKFRHLFFTHGFLLIVLLAGYILQGRSAAGRDAWVFWLDCGLAAWILMRAPKNSLVPMIKIWFLVSTVLCFIHIFLLLKSNQAEAVPSWLKHAYHFGFWILLVFFPAVGMLISRRSAGTRMMGLVVGIVTVVYILIDLKTAPLLVFFAASFAFAVSGQYQFKTKAVISIVVIMFGVSVAALFLQGRFIKDFLGHLRDGSLLSAHSGPMLTAVNAGISNPLTGVGFGNFPYVSGRFEPAGLSDSIHRAHNSFLELFAETGFPGLLTAILLMCMIFRVTFQIPKRRILPRWVHLGLNTSLGAAVLLGLMDFGLQIPVNALTIAWVVGLLLANARRGDQSQVDRPVPYFRHGWMLPIVFLSIGIPGVVSGLYFDRARHLQDKGMALSAVRNLDLAEKWRNSDDRLSSLKADLLLRLFNRSGQPEYVMQAAGAIDRSLQQNPYRAGLYFARALIDEPSCRLSDSEKLKYLSTSVSLDPSNCSHNEALMAFYLNQGMNEPALDLFEKTMGRKSGCRDMSSVLVFYWNPPQSLPEALSARLDRLTSGTVQYVLKSWIDHGLDLLARQFLKERFGELADRLKPDEYRLFAQIAIELKEPDLADEIISGAFELEQKTSERSLLWALKGRIDLMKERYDLALSAYDQALKLDPANVPLMLARIESIRRLRGPDAVLMELQDLVKHYPGSAALHVALGNEFERRGASLEALYEYQQAESIQSASISHQRIENLYRKIGVNTLFQRATPKAHGH